MTDIRKNILKKINQGGSMMVEAMAMLALIALVTPTLYKKSAERTTELQDINTAAHIRTLSKAVDNYVSANYQELLKNELETEDKLLIDLTTDDHVLKSYLPYGYSFETLKNFDIPKVTIKRSENSITAFVQLPKKSDIGEMRAARIASMIGSNGGYIDSDGAAKGVGGVWNLKNKEVTELNFDDTLGSVVVASNEAINSANADKFENEMYLQRTPANAGEEWRNTMTTDLYMGSDGNLNKILGAEQLVIGSVGGQDEKYGLYIDGADKDAYIGGALEAIGGDFIVNDDVFDYNGLIVADNENLAINLLGDTVFIEDDHVDIGANLNVSGDTHVATGPNSVFQAGQGGAFIDAKYGADNKPEVILGGDIKITDSLTTIDNDTEFKNKVKIGEETPEKQPTLLSEEEKNNLKLNVQGNAFVSGTLEAGTIKTGEMDLKELHAGGDEAITEGNEEKVRWLHATKDGGVRITDIANDGAPRLIVDETITGLFGKGHNTDDEASKIVIGDTNTVIQGKSDIEIKSSEGTGKLRLQHEAMILEGKDNTSNSATINAKTTTITSNEFKIGAVNTEEGAGDALYVNTAGMGEATINVEKLAITNNELFQVLPDGTSSESDAAVKIDKSGVTFTASASNDNTQTGGDGSTTTTSTQILAVNIADASAKADNGDTTNNASVYIRRGAIELEPSIGNGSVDDKGNVNLSSYSADTGTGYIEASRFVSNATENGVVATPVVAGDYSKNMYYNSDALPNEYDRYMVNPAYTSVMHDIKLTTRGGARISDMLPDFINKGIYVVTNTYKDNLNINEITATLDTSNDLKQVVAEGAVDMMGQNLMGTDRWASAFLGIIPAPQCPPGHARVVTITPAGFKMGQTGKMTYQKALNPFNNGNEENRFVIDSSKQNQENILGQVATNGNNATVHYLGTHSATISSGSTSSQQIYYLGFSETEKPNYFGAGNPTEVGIDWAPEPLYFQQSTWLRSKVIPQKFGFAGDCNNDTTNNIKCSEDFAGWSAIMGFVYPKNTHTKIINKLLGKEGSDIINNDPENAYYWNVFPVETGSLEGYATVYCYFDRNNIFNSGIDGKYVDQYDQLNYFREGYAKDNADTINFTQTGTGEDATVDAESGTNSEYIQRLNDPTLKYNQPW